jgi:hypothetical protein
MLLAYPANARPAFAAVDTFTYFPDQRATIEQNLEGAGIDSASVELREAKSYDAAFERSGAGPAIDSS